MPPSRLRQWLGATMLLLLAAVARPAAAQDAYTIRGTVLGTGQAPLTGATVAIRGTQISTVTNASGAYTLQARLSPGTYTVLATLLGRQTGSAEIALGAERTVQVQPIVLAEGAITLDELIVTGTAAPTSRRAIGNSVATVSATQLEQSGALTIDQALQGKVSGAVITSNTGTPGGGVSIRLRGTSSITGGAEPLYIVDGVIIDNNAEQQINVGYRSNPVNRLADLDPADIDRIEILKGAAAAALYGSRANNGVVQIFTKRGQAGKTQFTVSSSLSRSDLPRRIDFALTPVDLTGAPVARYDHQNLLFREGGGRDLHVAASGGADETRYFLSANYTEQEGIMRGSAHDKLNLRLNLDQDFGSLFSLAAGVNYVRSNTDLIISGEQGEGGLLTAIVFTPTTVDLAARNPETGEYANTAGLSFPNPLAVIDSWDLDQAVDRFVGSFQARANPMRDLTLEYRLGYDSYRMETQQFIPRTPGFAPDARAVSANRFSQLINSDVVGNFLWGPLADLQLTTSGGVNYTYQRVEQINASARDITPGTRLVRGAVQFASESVTELATLGVFGQQQASFRDRLFLTGAGRWDASSTFGADERWQFYPKASASYVISEEPFFRESALGNSVGELRLRGAIGFAGNQPPLEAAYARESRYGTIINVDRLGLIPLSTAGNPNLKPERQREVELGMDVSAFSDRVGLSATWYNQYTEDLLLPRPFAPSAGVGAVLDNIGELSNEGIELQLETVNLAGERFGWSSTVIYSRNRNRLEKLVGDPYSVGYGNRIEEGLPIGMLFLADVRRDDDGNVLTDSVGPLLGPAAIVGNPWPEFTASLRNEFRMGRSWTFSFLLDGQFGHELWNQTQRIMDGFGAGPLYDEYLRGEISRDQWVRHRQIASNYVEDASFVKLRDLTLRYSVPAGMARRFGATGAQLELQGRNLHTWTEYTGYDPEINMFGLRTVERGVDFAVYPNAREVSFGVRLNF